MNTLAQDPTLKRWIDRVAAARADRRPLAIQGGGSKAFYGEASAGALFDTRELRGISAYEPSELVITARAGTPLAELEAALAECGQYLPFEPPRFTDGGTVGGMVAAGLAGPSRWMAGSVRDHVLGACLLNGQGELLQFGGQVIKNVAGYDVSRLLVGSMGILGVICEVSLKVLPRPPAQLTLRFDCDEAEAIRRLNTWAGQALPLNASAWWRGTLVLRLAGAAPAVQAAAAKLGGERLDAPLAQGFWTGLRDHTDEFFGEAATALSRGGALWRVSLPATAPALDLPGDALIEWGGSLRWCVTRESAATVRAAAQARGGEATLMRGKLDAPTSVMAPLSPVLMRLHQQLKTAFDPDRVFNPGRLYPDL